MPAVALHGGKLQEERDRVAQIGGRGWIFERAERCQRFKVAGEFGPGGEPMRAGEDQLRVGQGECGDWIVSGIAQTRMPAADVVEGIDVAALDGAKEFFGLLLVLFKRRAGGKFRHTKLLSYPQKREAPQESAQVRLKEDSLELWNS
jgi:hypothetical protein